MRVVKGSEKRPRVTLACASVISSGKIEQKPNSNRKNNEKRVYLRILRSGCVLVYLPKDCKVPN